MSWIDGFELCKAVKKNEEFRDIPVVFVSGAAARRTTSGAGGRRGGLLRQAAGPQCADQAAARAGPSRPLRRSPEHGLSISTAYLEPSRRGWRPAAHSSGRLERPSDAAARCSSRCATRCWRGQAAAAGPVPGVRRGRAAAEHCRAWWRTRRARSSTSTPTRWCTTTCRPWTTTICAAGGPPTTRCSARRMAILAGDALLTEAFALVAGGRGAGARARSAASWPWPRARRAWWAARCWTSPRTARRSIDYLRADAPR